MAGTGRHARDASLVGTGLLGQVLAHAQARPGRLAAQDDTARLTYAELVDRAAAAAAGLATLGARRGDRVVLLLDNSVDFVVMALGCMWLGAPFVPLSPENPSGRVVPVLDDCRPTVVVAGAEALAPADLPTGCRMATPEQVREAERSTPGPQAQPDGDAYIIYTSGTTGRPKGVRTPARALSWAIAGALDALDFGPSTRSLCVSSFQFDGSYGTLFPTLAAGGSLIIPPRSQLLFLKRFFRSLVEDEVTDTSCSPTYLRMLLASPLASRFSSACLRTLTTGGEQLRPEDVARLWHLLPSVRVFNRYGPTETTIAVTTYQVSQADVGSGHIPIGLPHAGTDFFLLDNDGEVIEGPGVEGQLYISGPQLMAGYWGDPDLSRNVMRSDIADGIEAYRTGDRAYRDQTGRYFFRGRDGDMVKRRGMRLSLVEVEQALARVEGVSAVACASVEVEGEGAVVAFVDAAGLGPRDLLEASSAYLPQWMQPDELHFTGPLPTTTAGKVDRDLLLAQWGYRRWSGA